MACCKKLGIINDLWDPRILKITHCEAGPEAVNSDECNNSASTEGKLYHVAICCLLGPCGHWGNIAAVAVVICGCVARLGYVNT